MVGAVLSAVEFLRSQSAKTNHKRSCGKLAGLTQIYSNYRGVALKYNALAGQSLERLAALSDGVFAIAMTLLVLDLRLPLSAEIHSEADLWRALIALSPRLITYLMSFMTLGIFWLAQQTQLSSFARSDRDLAWIHIGFLLAVSIMPFSTGLLAEFITYRLAIVCYWLNLLLLGIMLFASVRYAWRAKLMKDDATAERACRP